MKIRLELRLPKDLVDAVDAVGEAVGLQRNAFFAIAISLLASQLAMSFLPGAKRQDLFDRFEKRVLADLERMRKRL